MARHAELIDLEREGWRALASSGADARRFYDRTLHEDVLLLLPGGLVIDDRAAALDSMGGAPWDGYDLDLDEGAVHPLRDGAAVVAYRGRAQRGDTAYEALFSSTYVHHGGAWRLAVHQQTPV